MGANRDRLSSLAANIMAAVGILVAVFGIGVDFVLPNASPGLNVVQLLIIVTGLAIAAATWQLRRPSVQQRLSRILRRPITAGLVITLLTLFILELVLTVAGMSLYFPQTPAAGQIVQAPWLVCDEPGCHYDYESVRAACEAGKLTSRTCTVNRQGYSDSQDFMVFDEYGDELRVLALGDSFTFGLTADIGKSYIEYLEARFPDSEIWNTGIAGTGTNQAIAAFEWFAPQLRPQLATLGFVNNDFKDNLTPVNTRFSVIPRYGDEGAMRTHWFDTWGNVYEADPQTIMHYGMRDVNPPRNGLERVLGGTRLGTLALRLSDGLGTAVGGLSAKKLAVTREYLSQLQDLTRAHDSALLVLVVPRREDIESPSAPFLAAIGLMEELGISYMNPAHLLDPVDDFAIPPDEHWSTAGHQKVGAYLSDCVAVFIESGDLTQCDNVVYSGD